MRRSSGVGGGCCTTRYSTSSYIPSYYTNDVSKMDRIMLRFRPIAPKPVTSGPTSTSSSSGSSSPKKRKSPNKTTKPNNNNNTRKKSRSPSKDDVVTLSLLPETPDLTPNCNNDNNGNKMSSKEPTTWLNFGPSDEDLTALEVIPSTVTVEKVSATWQHECITDEERKRRLEVDTCPGFISDGWNRVWWTNEEYRKMVTGGDTWRKERLVSVKMEMRERVVNIYGGGFTCRVRLQYGNSTMTVPCDVWRMNNNGGFAWRLDVKAALTLAL